MDENTSALSLGHVSQSDTTVSLSISLLLLIEAPAIEVTSWSSLITKI